MERLKLICARESIEVSGDDVFNSLIDISQGDLRRSINMLQTASAFKSKNLCAKDIESISGVIPDDVVKGIDQTLTA
jgi:replication factor C subunit 2/4